MKAQPSVLVIDDEPDNFDVVETLLHEENYQLNYASSGQKAIDRLETFCPDVILLDVMMPDLNGIEVCRRIKAMPRWQPVPIIMVTALSSKEDLAQCLAAGASDFITKPLDRIELKARVRSMLRLKHRYDGLLTLLQLREDMVNMMVHDLRNPLASIVLSTEFLRFPGLTPEEQRKKVDQIAIAGHQLQSLIDSLLLLAKLESDKMVLNCTEVDLCALCLSALSDFEAIAAQKKLELVSQLPTLGSSAKVDVPVFRRILDNLLSNAIKFAPTGSQVVLQMVNLDTGDTIIQVADLGPGVSEDLKQRIFEKYETGALIKDVSQIGLGLAFCKMAIEAHGGRIKIEDNNPQGTVLSISLPKQADLARDESVPPLHNFVSGE